MKNKAWSGPGGALITDAPIQGVTNIAPMDEDCQRFYGGSYFIGESLSPLAAKTLAEALGLEFVLVKEDI